MQVAVTYVKIQIKTRYITISFVAVLHPSNNDIIIISFHVSRSLEAPGLVHDILLNNTVDFIIRK